MALFEAAENLKTENGEISIELNDSNLLDDKDLQDFNNFKMGTKSSDIFDSGRPATNSKQQAVQSQFQSKPGKRVVKDYQRPNQIDNDLRFLEEEQYDTNEDYRYLGDFVSTDNQNAHKGQRRGNFEEEYEDGGDGYLNHLGNEQALLGMTNTLDLEGSREYKKNGDDELINQQSSFMSNPIDLDLNQ